MKMTMGYSRFCNTQITPIHTQLSSLPWELACTIELFMQSLLKMAPSMTTSMWSTETHH